MNWYVCVYAVAVAVAAVVLIRYLNTHSSVMHALFCVTSLTPRLRSMRMIDAKESLNIKIVSITHALRYECKSNNLAAD